MDRCCLDRLQTGEYRRPRRMSYELLIQWQNPTFWRSLAPEAFEREVALLFEASGWTTEHTGRTRDGGIDVKVSKPGIWGFIQCKQYSGPVGVAFVREICGVSRTYGGIPFLVAPSGFTPDACAFAIDSGVRLLAINELVEMARQAEPSWQEEMLRQAELEAEEEAQFRKEVARVANEISIRDDDARKDRIAKEAEFERTKAEWLAKNGLPAKPMRSPHLRLAEDIDRVVEEVRRVESVRLSEMNRGAKIKSEEANEVGNREGENHN